MATSYSYYVGYLASKYEDAEAHYSQAKIYLAMAREYENNEMWADYREASMDCHAATLQSIRFLLGIYTGSFPRYRLIQVLTKDWEYEYQDTTKIPLGWKPIIEAWAKDDFEGKVMIIGFIDRMRQLLWNEPYSIKWAAKPELEEKT